MFENIIGHEANKKFLHDSVDNDKISHAYLFVGQKGIGKSLIAKEFSKEILKTENLNSCPDFKYITKKEDKKDIVIEQIRKDLIDDVYLAPISTDKKVYIIDEAENLNIASQNALLKTLEEPPTYVCIILVSSNISSFLPTILSRVDIVNFCNIEDDELNKFIIDKYKTKIDDNLLSFIDGSIGQAVNIIENNLQEVYTNINKLFEYIINKDVISTLKMLETTKFDNNLLDYLEFLLYKNGKIISTKFVERAKNRLKMNGNYDIVIDNMIINIIDTL